MMRRFILFFLVCFLMGCGAQQKIEKQPMAKEALAPSQEQKRGPIDILEERLNRLEKNQAILNKESEKIEKNFEELSTNLSEIKKRQAKMQLEQARVQEEQIVKKIIAEKEGRPKSVKKDIKKTKPLSLKKKGSGEEKILGNNPYGVHVSSHKSIEQAIKEVREWQQEGFLAYISLFNVPKKGKWYRVVIDRFKNKKDADDFAAHLKKIKEIKYSKAILLPYSIEIKKFDSYEEATKEEALLLGKGYLPHIIPFQSPTKGISYQILVGAYQTKKEAKIISEKLKKDGYRGEVILP
jgi:cell division septation protein DedD